MPSTPLLSAGSLPGSALPVSHRGAGPSRKDVLDGDWPVQREKREHSRRHLKGWCDRAARAGDRWHQERESDINPEGGETPPVN